ncbi:MAG TPA: gluconate 2-dehydrogenase subunit 3 family protein [Acidimicrobiales bacterium]|nr:gluconate 2-dehydrogenase subunit 3 family protein [Acidimicrobiales bacterium]
MTAFFTEAELVVVAAAVDRLIPPDDLGCPGAAAAGAADYIDTFLGAFTFDPPRIFAGGPFSGRWGGDATFENWLPLGRMEELAWRTRIEGSNGAAEREFNGAVIGLQQMYRDGIAALGDDFATVDDDEQDARLTAVREFRSLLYQHACEGMYGDPVYGGNRNEIGWKMIGWIGDIQPRGFTKEEVESREKLEIHRPNGFEGGESRRG